MTGPQPPQLSVIVSTRNRRADLMRVLGSVAEQSVSCEVVVLDDASTDGTAEAVAHEMPDALVIRSDRRLGLIAQRQIGAEAARAPVIAIIDDDCELISPRTFAEGLAAFDHPRIGAVALPLVDVFRDRRLRNRAPDEKRRWITDMYPGAAALIRRDAFFAAGGYRGGELQFRGIEDADHCRRLLAAGWVVRLTCAPQVHHHVGERRESAEDVRSHVRAHVMGAAWTLPASGILRHAAVGVAYGVRHGHPVAGVRGVGSGAHAAVRTRRWRRPLEPRMVSVLRRLQRERQLGQYETALEDIERWLPRLRREPVPRDTLDAH
jgi:GT2 family glycosyltransferase